MNDRDKISPAFGPFLARSGADDKREAIVIYRAEPLAEPRVRGRMRALRERLQAVEERATVQRAVQEKSFSDYRTASSKSFSGKSQPSLTAESIGGSKLPVAIAEVTKKTLPALAAQQNVVAILPNQKIHLIAPRQVDYTALGKQENKDGLTWGLKQLGIPDLWAKTKGKDINVAVLDTGVHGDHPALAGRVKDFVVIDPLGRRITTNGNATFDADQHGTHVCGTIGGGKTETGLSIGVAPEVNLLVAGVLIGNATLRTLFEGISWAVEKGADIISMSLGFSYYEPLFAEVFKMLLEQYGVLPVVAIGNENYGNSSSPGNAYNALSVGALEKTGKNVDVAPFSSGASLVFPGDETNPVVTKPDVVAPGAQVFSCIPPEKRADGEYLYTYMDGTSMATPHVAGVAALLMAARPEATAQDIARVLKETAKHPVGTERRPDNRWGYGWVQPAEALNALA